MIPNGQYQNFQRQEIVKVNGENGARAYQIPPNSSALLLDETSPIVWLVQTDGAGYKTATPYTITPYQPEKPVDVSSLETRISRLEQIINESYTVENEHTVSPKKSKSVKADLE